VLYYLAKLIMTPTLACYFRRSDFLDADRIPSKGPLVVIASHAASFLDAILMGVMMKRPIHFYVRGDIFRKAWVRWVFSKLHMIPIYSADLAKNDMHRNAQSFDQGAEILRKGGALLIFPEGLSRLERNILPFKKGAARIIMQALERSPGLKVHVVPIGIHYSRHAFRADVQLVTGEIIEVSKYREENRDNAPKALNAITEEMQRVFRKMVLYVDQPDRSLLLEQQLEMLGHEENGRFDQQVFRRQKGLCQSISALPDEVADDLMKEQDSYFAQLNRQELHDQSFTNNARRWPFIGLLLGFPFFAAGALMNIAPYLLGKYMADTRVTRADFYTSVLVAVSGLAYIFWLLFWLIMALAIGNQVLLILVLLAPILGWFGVKWMDAFRRWRFEVRYETLLQSQPLVIQHLLELRRQIRRYAGGAFKEVPDHH
jgi:1-acyl-sn-glycerol-3-phosphate acyltransferase